MVNLNDNNKPEPTEPDEFISPETIAENDEANGVAEPGVAEETKHIPEPSAAPRPTGSKLKTLLASYWAKKKWTLPATAAVILGMVMAIPLTRYWSLGLFLKAPVRVVVLDSKTHQPVSSATVVLDGQDFKTDGAGVAAGKAKLGKVTVNASKQYYTPAKQAIGVTFSKQHNSFTLSLVATGRQVPLKVANKITGKPVAGAVIKVLNTEAKTDKNGAAILVLPATAATQKATVSLGGYNTVAAVVTVTDRTVAANSFSLVPSGKLYFLSNQTGKIDVVKTDLDGSNRQVVVAGTGSEDPNNTSLLAARDWKYLALLAKRGGDTASVYLLDTSTDKLTTIDEGNATFSLVGWSNDIFVYQVDRNGVQSWQSKAHALKSYNAVTGKLTTLDETDAEGSSGNDYGYTNFSDVYLLDNEVFYAKNWFGSYYTNHLNGKNISLVSVKPDGTGKKTVKDFPIPDGRQYYSIALSLYEPYGVYVQVPNATTGAANAYYEYEDGAVSPKSDVTDQTFAQPYPTYLLSPGGKSTLWTDQRDGKNVLFVGDNEAKNARQIASLSQYSQYGWYTDDYLLVSKNSSELYIIPSDGSVAPQKVTDYYKPPVSYRGYGGGYGGF